MRWIYCYGKVVQQWPPTRQLNTNIHSSRIMLWADTNQQLSGHTDVAFIKDRCCFCVILYDKASQEWCKQELSLTTDTFHLPLPGMSLDLLHLFLAVAITTILAWTANATCALDTSLPLGLSSSLPYSTVPLCSLRTTSGRIGVHMVHRVLSDGSGCAFPLASFSFS